MFFKSSDSVEAYIELIDVKNNEYQVYDSEGKTLDLFVELYKRKWLGITLMSFEIVKIRMSTLNNNSQEQLKPKMLKLLKDGSRDAEKLDALSFKELVDRCFENYPEK